MRALACITWVLEHSVEEWDQMLAVNLRGAILGIKVFCR